MNHLRTVGWGQTQFLLAAVMKLALGNTMCMKSGDCWIHCSGDSGCNAARPALRGFNSRGGILAEARPFNSSILASERRRFHRSGGCEALTGDLADADAVT